MSWNIWAACLPRLTHNTIITHLIVCAARRLTHYSHTRIRCQIPTLSSLVCKFEGGYDRVVQAPTLATGGDRLRTKLSANAAGGNPTPGATKPALGLGSAFEGFNKMAFENQAFSGAQEVPFMARSEVPNHLLRLMLLVVLF